MKLDNVHDESKDKTEQGTSSPRPLKFDLAPEYLQTVAQVVTEIFNISYGKSVAWAQDCSKNAKLCPCENNLQ